MGVWLGLIALAAGFAVGGWFRVREVVIPLGVPEPVQLVVMSDIHVGAYGRGTGRVRRAVAEAMKQRPDAVFLVGDFVSSAAGIPYIGAALRGLRAPLGVYAVLGNHDHWADADGVRQALQAAGVRVLVNQSAVLRKGRTRLALVGIDDLWAGEADWEAAWRQVPPDVPAVLLSHNPDGAIHPQRRRARLVIAGHTHGGKIRLPRCVHRLLKRVTGRGLIPASEYGVDHICGLFREDWGWVYITSGLAAGASPPRWYTQPELAVLELR